MKRALLIALLIAMVLCGLVYLGDYVSLRYRIPRNRAQFGSVQVELDYAVQMKNRSTEYMFNQPTAQACVYSMFPHFGDPPCWYLQRHTRKQVNVQ